MELIYSMRRKPLKYEPPHFESPTDHEVVRPICTISTCNIIAFSSPTELDDTEGDTWGGHVYVCDLDTPWNCHKVTSTAYPVSALEWDMEGKQLLVATTVGDVSVYTQKDYLLNEWSCVYTASFPGEHIIRAVFFHNGRRLVMVDKKPDAPITERIQMLRSTPTLKGFGGVACEGACIITATGLIGVLTPAADGARAHVATDCLRPTRDHITAASIAHKNGSLVIAAVCRSGGAAGRWCVRCVCAGVAASAPAPAIALSPLPTIYLPQQDTQPGMYSHSPTDGSLVIAAVCRSGGAAGRWCVRCVCAGVAASAPAPAIALSPLPTIYLPQQDTQPGMYSHSPTDGSLVIAAVCRSGGAAGRWCVRCVCAGVAASAPAPAIALSPLPTIYLPQQDTQPGMYSHSPTDGSLVIAAVCRSGGAAGRWCVRCVCAGVAASAPAPAIALSPLPTIYLPQQDTQPGMYSHSPTDGSLVIAAVCRSGGAAGRWCVRCVCAGVAASAPAPAIALSPLPTIYLPQQDTQPGMYSHSPTDGSLVIAAVCRSGGAAGRWCVRCVCAGVAASAPAPAIALSPLPTIYLPQQDTQPGMYSHSPTDGSLVIAAVCRSGGAAGRWCVRCVCAGVAASAPAPAIALSPLPTIYLPQQDTQPGMYSHSPTDGSLVIAAVCRSGGAAGRWCVRCVCAGVAASAPAPAIALSPLPTIYLPQQDTQPGMYSHSPTDGSLVIAAVCRSGGAAGRWCVRCVCAGVAASAPAPAIALSPLPTIYLPQQDTQPGMYSHSPTDGSLVIAAVCRSGGAAGRWCVRCVCAGVAASAPAPAIALSPLPTIYLPQQDTQPVSITWCQREDTDSLLIAGATLTMWKCTERAHQVHKLFAKGPIQGNTTPGGGPKPVTDCFNTLVWQKTVAWGVEGGEGAVCAASSRTALGAPHAVLATPRALHLLARDTHHYLCSRAVITSGGISSAVEASSTPPKKAKYGTGAAPSAGGCAMVSCVEMSHLGGVVLAIDTHAQLHLYKLPQPWADIPTPIAVQHATNLLEYAVVSGCDCLDVLVACTGSIKHNILELMYERLTESFQRQPAAFQQYYFHSWLKLRIALCRLIPSAQSSVSWLTCLQSLQASWAAVSLALRPDDKPDAAPLAALLDDHSHEQDKTLLTLEAKPDAISEAATLQPLRLCLQRAIDIGLTALLSLAYQHQHQMHPNHYEVWADGAAVQLVRRLACAARAGGRAADALLRPLARLAAPNTPKQELIEECLSLSTQWTGARVWESLPRCNVAAPHGNSWPLYLEYGVEPEALRYNPEPPGYAQCETAPSITMDAIRYMYVGGGLRPARWRQCGRCGSRALAASQPNKHPLQAAYDGRFLSACRCGGKWTLFSNI